MLPSILGRHRDARSEKAKSTWKLGRAARAGVTEVDLKAGHIVRGSILPEPIKLIATVPIGDSVKLIGERLRTGQVHQPILTGDQLTELEIAPEVAPFPAALAPTGTCHHIHTRT